MDAPSSRRRLEPTLRTASLLFVAVALSCGDASSPPVPTDVTVDSGDGQSAVVATALPVPLAVRVTDAEGRGIAGVAVTWSTSGTGGTLTPTSGETGGDGRASATWTLGTVAGAHSARATVAGLPPVTFSATARSGAVQQLLVVSGDGQRAEVGEALAEPLRIRLEDSWGNAVAGAAVTWTADGGTLAGADAVSGGDGTASATWVMGRDAGPATVTARGPDGPGGGGEVQFGAVAEPTTLNLSVANAYLVQSVQRWTGDVPLIEGRPGLLRVFVDANRATSQKPVVRVRVWDAGGGLLGDELIDTPPGFAPGQGVSEEPVTRSYNLQIPGDWMSPGIRLDVGVDPDDDVVETAEDDNVFPAGGAGLAPDVRGVPPVRVTFVPIRINGAVGTIETPELMVWDAGRMFPVREVETQVRADTLDLGQFDLLEAEAWPQVVSSVLAARVAEGAETTWYGVVPRVEGAPFGGWALIGGPAAVGVEGATLLTAHELGHTWGRRHPPCGSANGVDVGYPYADAATGVYGFDLANSLIQLPTRTDIMSYSYCGDRHWISDYTYEAVLEFRAAQAAAAASRASAPPREALIVWGRVEGDSLVLEPAFRAVVPPVLPSEPGPFRIEGVDDAGARLFDLRFRPTPVADAPNGSAVFAFAIPVAESAQVASIRLSDGARTTEVRSPASLGPSELRTEVLADGRVRLAWDATRHPMVVVRDADSGAVLSMARGGEAVLTAPTGRALEATVSGGADGAVVVPIRR